MDNYPHEGENKFYTKTYYNQNFKSNSLNPLDSKRVTVNNLNNLDTYNKNYNAKYYSRNNNIYKPHSYNNINNKN